MGIVRFQGIEAPIAPGQDLLGALFSVRAPIRFLCMGGTCGTCRVRVTSGGDLLEPLSDRERSRLNDPATERLACQAILARDGIVELIQEPRTPRR